LLLLMPPPPPSSPLLVKLPLVASRGFPVEASLRSTSTVSSQKTAQ
jgi:hypothetical protein